MSVEMAIPFALGPDGSVALVSDPFLRISQRVKAIVGSRPTERVMDINFGLDIDRMVFEPDDETAELELAELVGDTLRIYEPGVDVIEVVPEMTEHGDGISSVLVNFRLSEDPTGGSAQYVNTAIIQADGNVKEIIRG